MIPRSWRPFFFSLAAPCILLASVGTAVSPPRASPDSPYTGPTSDSAEGRALTALLIEYLEAEKDTSAVESLRLATSEAEQKRALWRAVETNLFNVGAKMFSFFEARAAAATGVDASRWTVFDSEHFVFAARPGGAASQDRDRIVRAAEETYASVAASLGLGREVERGRALLHNRLPEESDAKERRVPGKILVFLRQARSSDGAERIPRSSFGITSFGATIASEGESAGEGRLTASIHILYFNAFSLFVLHHEISHAVLLLGSFEPKALLKPLDGKSALKKAFFDGYRSLPPFLHEGVGDYAVYYHGLYQHWGMLPDPERLVQELTKSGQYIPLAKLLKEGRRFRMENHKAYSLEAAVFLQFLLERHGRDRVKAWLLAGERNPSRSFRKVFERPLEEVEKDWHSSWSSPPTVDPSS